MVDEVKTADVATSTPAVETAAPASTPEISTALATPAASTEAAASSAPAEPVVAKETPKAETPTPSNTDVLGAEPVVEKKEETKSVEKALESKTPDTKPVQESGKPAEKPTLPTYEEFKLPEGITLEKEATDAFTNILGEIETGKLDHKGMQEAGQKLIDLAAQSTTKSIERLNDYYVELHNNSVKARVDALKADPELGGENFEKTVSALQATVREYGGTEAQIAEFRKEITESGLSASPAVCRLIYNMQQKINKYTTEQSGPSIVPGQKPAPTKVKPYEAFYQGNRA